MTLLQVEQQAMSGRDWLRKKSSIPNSRTSFPNRGKLRRFKAPQPPQNFVQLSPEQLKNAVSFGYNAFKLPINVQQEPPTTEDITGNEPESKLSLDGSINQEISSPLPDDTTAAQPEIGAIETPASEEVSQIQPMSDTDGNEAQQLQQKSEGEIKENQSETLDGQKEEKPSAHPRTNFIDIPVYTPNSLSSPIGIQPELTPFRLENQSQQEDESEISAQTNLEETIQQKQGSGDPLSDEVRQPMESAFGADFSGVKVHTDATSDKLNKSIQAKAFTTGKDIFFKEGEYQPHNREGQELIAHELTHVVQQTGAIQPKSIGKIARKENKLQTQEISEQKTQVIQRKENPQPATPSSAAKIGGSASPEKDPGFQSVANRIKQVAQKEKTHPPATTKSAEAQAAAVPPSNEVTSKAQNRQVEEMNQQQPGKFNAAAFKAALMEKIAAITPQTLEEADNFKNNNKIASVKGDLSSQVSQEKKQAANPIEDKAKEAPNTSGIPAKPVTPLPPNKVGTPTSDIGASNAAPKPKSEAEVSLKEGSQSLDKQMTDAKITEEQLAKSNEPQFQGALDAKKTAQTQANTAPPIYRQDEKATLTQAQGEAKTTAQTQLQGMHGEHAQILAKVIGTQGKTKGQDEQKRAEVANHIQGIYNKTKQNVEKSLGDLDKQVNQEFEQGAAAAKTEFENYVKQRMNAYKEERYSGLIGKGKWVKDKLFGMPSDVNAFYQEGKKQYLATMGKTIDKIANLVATKLNTAKADIAKGKQDIQKYVASLPQDLRQVGQEAAQNIQGQFDELEQSVDNKQNELVDSLAQKYNENLQAIDAKIDEMKAENRGLVDKATDAIAGTIKTIMQLKDMLMGVLAKAASAVEKIILDPIGFLGNLVSGIKQGFDNFAGNIITHLQTGLMGWLTGAIGALGLQLPDDIFSLQGIFSLVTQILGTTWNYIRMKAVKMFGEPIVAGMEKTVEIFQIIANKGPMGLWEHVQENFNDLKETVIEEIKGMLITQVITAGVKWIIGLLNPASAFVKAAMAIYDIVMFFINQGSQVVELVSAVTEAVVAIASGAVGGAAKLVENALAKSLPVVIGFLASLLGIGDLAKKVQGIVGKIRQRIDKAIDKVLQKAKSLFKGKKGKGNKDEEGKEDPADERTEQEKKADVHKAAVEAQKIMQEKDATPDSVKAKFPAIQSKYKLTSLELVKHNGRKYHALAKINPEEPTSDVELNGGERKPASIKKIFFASYADKNQVSEGEVWCGDWLLKKLNAFEPGLLDKDVDKRNKTIGNIRGQDEKWTVLQGAIYAPFIEDNRNAISKLQGQLDDCAYLLSIERGGSFVADQITRGKNIPSEKIEKRQMSEEEAKRLGTDKRDNYKVQQQADLKGRIKSLMSGKENENITIAIAETMVGGGSTNELIKTLEELLQEGLYPNLRFKLLLLQQTIHREDEKEGVILRKITRSEQIQMVISPTRYILGEDVGYQLAKSGDASKKPVIVFKGTQETLVAYEIAPQEDTTSRDIITDFNAGLYSGLLPGIL